MDLSSISAISPSALSSGRLDAHDQRTVVASFDALILRALLGEQGLFSAGEIEGDSGMVLGMFNALLADELARAIDLGFGRALFQAKEGGNQP